MKLMCELLLSFTCFTIFLAPTSSNFEKVKSTLSEDCDIRLPVHSRNPCEICRCIRGAINCKPTPCKGVTVAKRRTHGMRLSEDCNVRIPIPSRDPCEICRCIRGQINCKKVSCPDQAREICIAFERPGHCCPEWICGKDRFHCDPKRIVHLESKGPCEVCRCKKGRVRCKSKKCPTPSPYCTIRRKNDDQCCPDLDCDYSEDYSEPETTSLSTTEENTT